MSKYKLLLLVLLVSIYSSCTNDSEAPFLQQGTIEIAPIVSETTKGVDATADVLADGIRIYAQKDRKSVV